MRDEKDEGDMRDGDRHGGPEKNVAMLLPLPLPFLQFPLSSLSLFNDDGNTGESGVRGAYRLLAAESRPLFGVLLGPPPLGPYFVWWVCGGGDSGVVRPPSNMASSSLSLSLSLSSSSSSRSSVRKGGPREGGPLEVWILGGTRFR
ncbi:hypothetical protein SCUCBS95973_007800 [Sporothrix curviconia]|uniref:Uncharacterized protein n=1 Tax=Sporothrix curviconia TaxID=1260050 RepID=A0ABP0CHL4_9PEZI